MSLSAVSPVCAQWVRDCVAEDLPGNLGDVARQLCIGRRAFHE
jgi:hypothetical protein